MKFHKASIEPLPEHHTMSWVVARAMESLSGKPVKQSPAMSSRNFTKEQVDALKLRPGYGVDGETPAQHGKVTVTPLHEPSPTAEEVENYRDNPVAKFRAKTISDGITKKIDDKISESASQQAVIRWWAVVHKAFGVAECLLFAVPNQGLRTARNASRMKAEGMRAGVSDLFLLCPRSGCHGLAIEMKSKKGKVSESQKAFCKELSSEQYLVKVCHSASEAIEVIKLYFNA